MDKIKSLCQKVDEIFSKGANDLGFNIQIEPKINLKSDAKPVQFLQEKNNGKNCGRTCWADLFFPTLSNWAAPSILVAKKDETYRWVVDYSGLNKQIEKTFWPFPKNSDVIDSIENNMFVSSTDIRQGIFKWL